MHADTSRAGRKQRGTNAVSLRPAQETVAHHARMLREHRAVPDDAQTTGEAVTGREARGRLPTAPRGVTDRDGSDDAGMGRTLAGRAPPATDRFMAISGLAEEARTKTVPNQESEGGVSARALARTAMRGGRTVLADDAATRSTQPSRARDWLRFRGGASRRKGACNSPDQTRQVCEEAGVERQGEPDPRRGAGTLRCPARSTQLGWIGESAPQPLRHDREVAQPG